MNLTGAAADGRSCPPDAGEAAPVWRLRYRPCSTPRRSARPQNETASFLPCRCARRRRAFRPPVRDSVDAERPPVHGDEVVFGDGTLHRHLEIRHGCATTGSRRCPLQGCSRGGRARHNVGSADLIERAAPGSHVFEQHALGEAHEAGNARVRLRANAYRKRTARNSVGCSQQRPDAMGLEYHDWHAGCDCNRRNNCVGPGENSCHLCRDVLFLD